MTKTIKLRDEALAIAKAAEDESRDLTPEEQEKLNALLGQIRTTKAVEELQTSVTGPVGDGSLFAAAKAAGWERGKRVLVDRRFLKTASFTGSEDELSPIRREGAALAFDERYLANVFPSTGIADQTSSVQVLRQSSRTLPAAADVQRTFLQTDAKAEVASERELVDASVGILAAIESDIPNRLLIQDGMRSMVDNDLRLSILEAKDDSIVDAITASNPQPAGSAGADFIEGVRFAIAEMLDDGIRPSVLALNPTLAAEFDLTRTPGPESMFVFGPGAAARPPFGLRIVESKSVAYAEPLLIEPRGAGHRYEGGLALQTFEMNDGKTNTSLVRLEQSFLFHVERPAHMRIVTVGS